MDTLELITLASTSLEEELEFLKFVVQNSDVKIISSQLSLDGPIYLSPDDYRKIKKTGTPNECTLLLWNTSVANPLCSELFLRYYDSTWTPIKPDYGQSINIPQSKEDYFALHSSFRKQPITEKFLQHSMYSRLLSPVLEVEISSEKTKEKSNDYFGIQADFCNWVNKDVWIVWNPYEQKWEHETRSLDRLFDYHFEQLSEFIKWQEHIFDWIRKNWSKKIVPSSTYRYG